MMSILKAALQDLTIADRTSPVFRDAYKWCTEGFPYTGPYKEYVFSIDSVCLYLELDKSLVQKHVRQEYAPR